MNLLLQKFFTVLSNPIVLLIIILFFTAVYIVVKIISAFKGVLKYGRVISADHAPQGWRKPARPLFSKKYLLTGMVDYLVQEKDGTLTPVEVKSTQWRGRIYDSHRLEVGTACVLIEEQYHVTPKYGVIQYGGGETFKIPYTQDLKNRVIQTMNEMRSLRLPAGWQPDSRRCRSCSMRLRCDMAAG